MTSEPFVIPDNPGLIAEPKDPRDWPMRAALPDLEQRRTARPLAHEWSYIWPPLNQGNTGTCGGQTGEEFMLTTPVVRKQPGETPNAIDIYLRGIAPSTDLQQGMTMNQLMRSMRSYGIIDAWRSATDIEDVLDWLWLHGPVMVGTNWDRNMLNVDAEGYIKLGGGLYGNHAYLVYGFDLTLPRPAFKFLQSWGSWGRAGRGLISVADMSTLLFGRSFGEAKAAAEIDPNPPPPEPEPEPEPPPPPAPPVPPPPVDVFQYPYQQILTAQEAIDQDLPERAMSTWELMYVLEPDAGRFWTLYGFLYEGNRLDDPGRRFLVQYIQARHRSDWLA